jgi:hypothetical protein
VVAALAAIVPTSMAAVLAARLETRGLVGLRLRAAVFAGICAAVTVYPAARLGGPTGAALASTLLYASADLAYLTRHTALSLDRPLWNLGVVVVPGGVAGMLLASLANTLWMLAALGAASALLCCVLAVLADWTVLARAYRILASRS